MNIFTYNTLTGDLSGPGGSEGSYPNATAAAAHLATLGVVFVVVPNQTWAVRPDDHTHTVALDGPVHLDHLREETKAAGVHVNVREVDAGVQFFAGFALSTSDRTTLDAVASAHTGGFQVSARDGASLRISRHIAGGRGQIFDPSVVWDTNFNLLSPNLSKRIGLRDEHGYVTRWDYAPVNQNSTYGPDVVREYHPYTTDADSNPVRRDGRIVWLREDGVEHETSKPLQKWYQFATDPDRTAAALAKEGSKRRGALMDEAKGAIYGWLLAAGIPNAFIVGQDFLAGLGDDVKNYVEISRRNLITAIRNDPTPWLDTPTGLPVEWATPVREGTPLSGSVVSPRVYLAGDLHEGGSVLGILNIYGI